MNTACLWIVTALYTTQGAICAWHGQTASTAIMAGYVIANLGLIASMAGGAG